ncbi:MAG: cupin domain-containing protein [Negativicutes bacterium]|nr:cupin domain-containing protein [Negativicutes bacterium]
MAEQNDTQYTQVDEKVRRRIINYGDSLMLVEYRFQKGGIGIPHKHEDHEQIGYVAKGSFEILTGSETRLAKQGDSYYAPKNMIHGVVALEEDSVLIDAFTPIRADFLEK